MGQERLRFFCKGLVCAWLCTPLPPASGVPPIQNNRTFAPSHLLWPLGGNIWRTRWFGVVPGTQEQGVQIPKPIQATKGLPDLPFRKWFGWMLGTFHLVPKGTPIQTRNQ